MGPYLGDMEILLHRTQCNWDDLRREYNIITEENYALAVQLDEVRTVHDTSTTRNLALASQLRTTRLGRNRLTKKVEALQTANTILRGRLKTAREDLATRDSTIEELEEENTELHEENEDLLPDDDIPSDGAGRDWVEQSDQEDDDLLGDEEDPEEILFDGDGGQD